MSSIAELVAIKERVEAEYLARPGVNGIDVGYKVVGGVQTEEVAIRVHVEKKKASVPKAQAVPAAIDGVVTDVLERTYELQVVRTPMNVGIQADTTHYASLQGGISIGPSRVDRRLRLLRHAGRGRHRQRQRPEGGRDQLPRGVRGQRVGRGQPPGPAQPR